MWIFGYCRLPKPELEDVKVEQLDKRIAAAIRFNRKPTDELVEEKRKVLVEALRKDGLKMTGGFALARYNHPGSTYPLFMVLFLPPTLSLLLE